MDLCLIWTQDRAGAVVHQDAAPWQTPEHVNQFQETTLGCPVIMGRRTWQALGSRPLPGHQNIVLMRETDQFDVEGAVRSGSIGDAIMLAGSGKPAKAFIIGGADLHARALLVAQRIYVTEVDVEVEAADEFAPQVPPGQWTRHFETEWRASPTGMRYRFVEYRRAGRR